MECIPVRYLCPEAPSIVSVFQDFLVDSFNLSDVLRGTVRFTGVTSPIIAGHVRTRRTQEATVTLPCGWRP